MCCWNFANLPDPPLTIGETKSQFALSKPKPFQPVRLLISLRDSIVKCSGTVILSELSLILSSSGLLRVCCWSSTDLLNFAELYEARFKFEH